MRWPPIFDPKAYNCRLGFWRFGFTQFTGVSLFPYFCCFYEAFAHTRLRAWNRDQSRLFVGKGGISRYYCFYSQCRHGFTRTRASSGDGLYDDRLKNVTKQDTSRCQRKDRATERPYSCTGSAFTDQNSGSLVDISVPPLRHSFAWSKMGFRAQVSTIHAQQPTSYKSVTYFELYLHSRTTLLAIPESVECVQSERWWESQNHHPVGSTVLRR